MPCARTPSPIRTRVPALVGSHAGRFCADRTRSENARRRNERSCLRCGRLFQRARGAPGYFCSRGCAADAQRIYGDPVEAKRAEHARARDRKGIPAPTTVRCPCGITFMQRSHVDRYHSDDCRREANQQAARRSAISSDVRDRSARPCRNCGKAFAPAYGEKNRIFCSRRCGVVHRVRVKQASRRAKELGLLCESGLDPFDQFERDGWRCYICGEPTPRRLRGTRHPRAPELDHVIPLASGGDHAAGNVACACRACNFKKGSGDVEQPGYLMPDWSLLTT